MEGVGEGLVANGSIKSRWQALSGLSGELGYPITDELPVFKDAQEIGRVSRFQNGAMYLNHKTGNAFDVRGPILTAWEEQFGGAAGEFGFPISGLQNAPKSNKIFNDFEGGIIVLDNDVTPPQLLVVRQFEFFVTRFSGSGGDEASSSGSRLTFLIRSRANRGTSASAVIISQGTLKDGDDFFSSGQLVNLNFPIPGIVSSKTVVAVDFEGIDDDTGPNDALGRIIVNCNLDNGLDPESRASYNSQ